MNACVAGSSPVIRHYGYDEKVDMSGLDFDKHNACVGSSPTTRKRRSSLIGKILVCRAT